VKDAILNGVFEQFNKFVLVKNQVDAIMLAVFVFTKSERFPRGAIHLEEVSLNASLVVFVQIANADSPLLDGVHFGHDDQALRVDSTRI
jgi:hypothetical protein